MRARVEKRSVLGWNKSLHKWLVYWTPDNDFLDGNDWFTHEHDHWAGMVNTDEFWYPTLKGGSFFLKPSIDLADIAVEYIRKSCTKRCSSVHNFVCPKIMTFMW